MALYLAHPSSFEHDTGAHPENAARLRAIEAALDAAGWPELERVEAPAATLEQLRRGPSQRDHPADGGGSLPGGGGGAHRPHGGGRVLHGRPSPAPGVVPRRRSAPGG